MPRKSATGFWRAGWFSRVSGSACPAELLAGAADVPPTEAENALDEVLRARLLSPAVGKPREFEFPHALVRDVIYDEVSGALDPS